MTGFPILGMSDRHSAPKYRLDSCLRSEMEALLGPVEAGISHFQRSITLEKKLWLFCRAE